MKNSSREIDLPLSAQDVFVVLEEHYRFLVEFDPDVEPGVALNLDMEVDRWRSVCDLLPPAGLGLALNEIFGIDCSGAAWKNVLQPKNTLSDVCCFISENGAMKADSGPMKIAGKNCEEAGIFIALRTMFAKSGVPIAGMRPSTKLGPLLDDHFTAVFATLAKLAPRALPMPTSRCTELLGMELGQVFLLCLGILGTSYVFLPEFVGALACLFMFTVPVGYGTLIRKTRKKFGSDLHIAGIETLADLCRFIVQYKKLNEA